MSHLTPTQKALFNNMNGVSYVNFLGNKLSESLGCVVGTYDFSKQGGAIGPFTMKDPDGNPVKLPANALVLNAFVYVKAAVTSLGSATVAVTLESSGDLLAATAKASLTLAALVQGVPDFATVTDAVLTTVERTLTAEVAAAALIAGKIHAYVFYVLLP